MTNTPTDNHHPPIYEHLVRELGDVISEARRAAAHTQHKAAQLFTPRHRPHPNPPAGPRHP